MQLPTEVGCAWLQQVDNWVTLLRLRLTDQRSRDLVASCPRLGPMAPRPILGRGLTFHSYLPARILSVMPGLRYSASPIYVRNESELWSVLLNNELREYRFLVWYSDWWSESMQDRARELLRLDPWYSVTEAGLVDQSSATSNLGVTYFCSRFACLLATAVRIGWQPRPVSFEFHFENRWSGSEDQRLIYKPLIAGGVLGMVTLNLPGSDAQRELALLQQLDRVRWVRHIIVEPGVVWQRRVDSLITNLSALLSTTTPKQLTVLPLAAGIEDSAFASLLGTLATSAWQPIRIYPRDPELGSDLSELDDWVAENNNTKFVYSDRDPDFDPSDEIRPLL